MADVVELFLEDMIVQLEELQRAGIFSKEEIRSIIRKRRDFEYAVRRKPSEKKDFMIYIEYERRLNELIKKRKRILGLKLKPNTEFFGAKRIRSIYERSLRVFGHDLDMWMKYIEFCKNENYRILLRALARGLQYHPDKIELWSFAAEWEFKKNQNIKAARVFCQRGIRFNPTQTKLWLLYFKIELLYLWKVYKRKSFLLSTSSSSEVDKVVDSGIKTVSSPFLQGEILRTIYNNAIREIADNCEFRLEFYRLYCWEKIRGLKEIVLRGKEEIIESIGRDFFDDAKSLFSIANLIIEDDTESSKESGNHNGSPGNQGLRKSRILRAFQIFENAMISNKSKREKLWIKYVLFCEHLLKRNRPIAINHEKDSDETESQVLKDFLEPYLLLLYERATIDLLEQSISYSRSTALVKLYCQWIRMLDGIGRASEALDIASKCTEKIPISAALWYTRISLLVKSQLSSLSDHPIAKNEIEPVKKIILEALDKIGGNLGGNVTPTKGEKLERKSLLALFKILFDLSFITHEPFKETISNNFKRAMAWPQLNLDKLKLYLLMKVMIIYGIHEARKFYQMVLLFPPSTLAFYLECIKLEKNILTSITGSRNNNFVAQQYNLALSNIRFLYEKAVDSFGKLNEDIWVDYISFEIQQQWEKANLLYWRAKNTLENPTEFIRKYVMINNRIS